jgi:hypothetical protein
MVVENKTSYMIIQETNQRMMVVAMRERFNFDSAWRAWRINPRQQ